MEQEEKKISIKSWVKTPTVFQMEATECGAASLAMVLGYYGCNIPLEELRIECGVSRDGCNAKNVLKAARKYGLNAKGFSKSLDNMIGVPVPAIIHWNFNHFVVYEGCKGGYAYINDPASGRRKLSYEDLSNSFTGIVLTFEKTDQLKKNKKPSTIIRFAINRLAPEKKTLAALISAGLLLVFPGIVIPAFSQVFIDNVLIQGDEKIFGVLLLAMICTICFQAVFILVRGIILNKLQMKMSLVSGYSFVDRMFKLPINFFDQRYAGDLSQRIKNNDLVNNFLTGKVAQTCLDLFTACFYLFLLFFYSTKLAFVGITGIAITLILSFCMSKTLEEVTSKATKDRNKMVGVFFAGIKITSTLKASGAENEYASRILGHMAKASETDQVMGKKQQVMTAVPQAITNVFNVLVTVFGAYLVITGDLTAGTLVAFTQLLSSLTQPVNSLMTFFNEIQTNKANISQVEDIENYKLDKQYLVSEEKDTSTEKLSGKVELKNVSFGYSPLAPALITDFDFKLESGKTIALVGTSGCGKSTITKLVSGLYDPWEGEVLFDGVPLRNIPKSILNSSIATVSQDIAIFTGSIKQNLTLWNKLAMESDIVSACKDACIHDTITTLPGAYDYDLAEGGNNLSGGQRQRLEIARALVNNPTILVMDEATSALDPIVEKRVMDNIKKRGCTCVIVAHRLSTIRDADEILVMDSGHIIERGTHDELMKLDKVYAGLIKTQ